MTQIIHSPDVLTDAMQTSLYTPPPSPATLGTRFADFLDNCREEYRIASVNATASLNLDALKIAASGVIGSQCTSLFLIAEGGFNQIFALTFTNGRDLIARVNGGFSQQNSLYMSHTISYRIKSEAATLAYVRRNTSIPVPEVYAVVDDPNNPVGARYTLQERIIGRPLADVFCSLGLEQLESVIKQVAGFEGQLLKTRFTSIGSLSDQSLLQESREYPVGPLASSCVTPNSLRSDLGPWKSSWDWIRAYVNSEIDLLEQNVDEWVAERIKWRYRNGDGEQGCSMQTRDNLRTWYALLLQAINGLGQVLNLDEYDPPNMPFVLVHEEVSIGNVLVAYDDPTSVVGIIDWEGARVVPLWTCFRFDQLLEDNSIPDPGLSQLRNLRRSIHETIEPLIVNALNPTFPILSLLHIVSSCASTMWDISRLNERFMAFLEECSNPVHKAPFEELLAFVDSINHA